MVIAPAARLGIGVGVAATLAYLTTPVAITAARRLSFYDVPQGYKGHRRPTPYLGGAAVMLAFALATLVGAGSARRTLPLLAGVTVLWILGTLDDRHNLSAGLRVLVEVTSGVLLSMAGLGWQLGSGPVLDAVVTAVWILGVVNAFNLFDNMDGAASTMALVVTAGACVLAMVEGEVWVAAGCAALCGACLGFLPHNMSSPARIFLGDGGSMPLGFAVATLVANAARHAEPSSLGLLVGFLLVGIPALDTSLVIVSRRRRHIPLLTGGRDHLTHRTRQRMGTPRRVAVVLGGAQALLSGLVILASREGSSVLIYIVLTFIVFAAYGIVALENTIPIERAAQGDAVRRRGRQTMGQRHLADGPLAVIGLAAGLSPLFSAYYNLGTWAPIGLLLVVAAAMSTVARPPSFTAPTALAFFGLGFLGLWSLLSTSWASAAEVADVSANLWLTYAALLLLLIVLIDAGGHARTLLIAAGVGVIVVGLTVLVRMLGSDPGALFISGRLNSPLGYVNGEGCVFAMGAWLCLAAAERRDPLVAGLGATLTVGMACLALLSESRGALIATVIAAVVALAVVPGFRRRVLALAIVIAGIALAAPSLVRVYTAGENGSVPASLAHHAVVVTGLCALAAGLVWGATVALSNLIQRRGDPARALLGRVAAVAAVAVLVAPAAAVAIGFSSVERTARTQWHAFVHLSQSDSSSVQTRLLSGGGNRYDYWRVAWHVFTAHPIAGVGAGNYPQSYYRERDTDEAIENPHSLELQTLSELGVIGALALAVFLVGVGVGIRRLRRVATGSFASRTAMTAATGAFTVWLVDTSGDWMQLLPGVTAIALCAAVTLCLPGRAAARSALVGGAKPPVAPLPTEPAIAAPARGETTGSRLPMLISAAAAVCVLAIGGASLARAALARHYLDDARAALATDPAKAIADAQQVLGIDDANLSAYYVKAAGQARFDHAAAARSTLLQAAREAPGTFITWVLLGDLETRAGDIAAARSYYRHALGLDPLEPGLATLAADPETGLAQRP